MEVAKAESFALHEESSSQQPMGSHPSIHDRKEEISFSPSSGPVEEQPIGKRQRLDEDQVDQEEDQVIRDPVRVIRLDEIDITKLVLIQSFSVRYPKQWKLDECQSSLLNSVRSRFEICYQAATNALDEKDYPLLSACFEMVDCYGGIIKDLVDCAKRQYAKSRHSCFYDDSESAESGYSSLG